MDADVDVGGSLLFDDIAELGTEGRILGRDLGELHGGRFFGREMKEGDEWFREMGEGRNEGRKRAERACVGEG